MSGTDRAFYKKVEIQKPSNRKELLESLKANSKISPEQEEELTNLKQSNTKLGLHDK